MVFFDIEEFPIESRGLVKSSLAGITDGFVHDWLGRNIDWRRSHIDGLGRNHDRRIHDRRDGLDAEEGPA
jgi:hypothetical protein